MRSKCRAEDLERPVYIGLGVGLPIHQAPGFLSLLCARFLFLFGGGGTVSCSLVCLSVTLFLGTGRQLLQCDDSDELWHTELLIFSSGAHTRT